MTIELRAEAFNPWREIEAYQTHTPALAGKHGAISAFVGTMRDFNQGNGVQNMYLEHYPGMTEKQLQRIVEQARQQWSLLDTLVMHRVGLVVPDDTLVLVAAWATHRGDAFDACRYIMEGLKNRAPFWKKETLASGTVRWVEKNSDGYQPKAALNAPTASDC